VLIRGEEDLVTAVLLLLLPLQSLIYYGQPGEGMVEVVVSEELKEKIFTFFMVVSGYVFEKLVLCTPVPSP
jgi:uncharacterized protein (UPF0218 family)